MKALTIWPEWALAFQLLGKDIENRVWHAPPDLIGQRIALHAGRLLGGVVKPRAGGLGDVNRSPSKAIRAYSLVLEMARNAGWDYQIHFCGHLREYIQFFHRGKDSIPFAKWNFKNVPFGSIFMTAKLEWCSMLCGLKGWPYANGKPASPWSIPGQWGFKLTEIVNLEEPIPCRGRQKFWTVPEEIEEKIR